MAKAEQEKKTKAGSLTKSSGEGIFADAVDGVTSTGGSGTSANGVQIGTPVSVSSDATLKSLGTFRITHYCPCSIDFNKTALAGIEAMEDYFRSIQMPTSLHELGLDLTEKDIHDLAFKCSYEDTRTIGVFKQLNMKDMEKIYLAAR